ncbi:MAG: hypothetical protein ABIP50_01755 [Candidatus Saccharimonadales bacterium]
MRIIIKRLLTLGIAAFIIGLVAIVPSSITYAEENSGSGLEISPALVELNAVKGNIYTVNLSVTNVTNNNLVFNSFVNDFGSKDETGTPNVILDNTVTPTSIKTWVSNIPDFNLKAHEKKKLTATITVPSNAAPGGHYGVIRFSGHNDSAASSNVDLTASAGTLILLKVDGPVIEKVNLISFDATKNGKAGASFETGPITFVTRFENVGTVHVKPTGQIEVKDFFGNQVANLPINDAGGNVLPSSIRRFEATFDKSWMFGQYSAQISIGYGTRGGAIVESISFWVIPYKILLIGLILLITVIYILRGLIKRYNRYIIKNSHNGKKKNHKK